MSRFCVFCGEKPESKTREHVIPQWLISMTGDPKRQACFGFNINSPETKMRFFSFDQFAFPACDSCNNEYSELEGVVKKIMDDILNDKLVLASDISIFLDWLDKVRVGVWLGLVQLDKANETENPYLNVSPNFYIKQRVRKFDRTIIIERFNTDTTRLSISGTDSLSFMLTPSVFSLIVNNTCFTNISYMFLVSRRLGFPYPEKMWLEQDRDELCMSINPGLNRVLKPILKTRLLNSGKILHQPIIHHDAEFPKNYHYIKDHSMNLSDGTGNIFEQTANDYIEYKADDYISLKTSHDDNCYDFLLKNKIKSYRWHNWILEQFPDTSRLTSEQRKFIKRRFNLGIKINNNLIKHYINVLNKS